MLVSVGVEVERRGIRDVASGIVRNNSDVIANLTLIWVTLEWVKRIANSDVSRPGHSGVGAI